MAERGDEAEFEGRLREAEARAAALEERMADASLASRPAELAAAGRELAALRPLIAAGSGWREAQRGIAEPRELTRLWKWRRVWGHRTGGTHEAAHIRARPFCVDGGD